jgi:hypothetical protein
VPNFRSDPDIRTKPLVPDVVFFQVNQFRSRVAQENASVVRLDQNVFFFFFFFFFFLVFYFF